MLQQLEEGARLEKKRREEEEKKAKVVQKKKVVPKVVSWKTPVLITTQERRVPKPTSRLELLRAARGKPPSISPTKTAEVGLIPGYKPSPKRTPKTKQLQALKWGRAASSFTEPVTAKKLEKTYGVTTGLKPATVITGLTPTKTGYSLEYKPSQQQMKQAQREWRVGLEKQYPRDKYMILWRDTGAQIFEKQAAGILPTRTVRKFGALEQAAQTAFKGIQQAPLALPSTVVGTPKFKPVAKKFPGLAEPDIPVELGVPWTKEDLTIGKLKEKYGVTIPGLPAGARVTHVRKTEAGLGVKYLPGHGLDVAAPWGKYTEADIKVLEKADKKFAASMVKSYMEGKWLTAEYTPEQYTRFTEAKLDLPKGSMIVAQRIGPTGREVKYMALEDFTTMKEATREKGFWEIPLYEHLHSGLKVLFRDTGRKATPIDPLSRMRRFEKDLAYWPVGVMKGYEATVGAIEAITGRPSHRSYIPTATGAAVATAVSFFPKTQLGPVTIGKGGWGASGEFIAAEQASLKEHGAGILAGELMFDVLLGYVASKAGTYVGQKTWKGAKVLGAKIKPPLEKATVTAWRQVVRPAVRTTLGIERYQYYRSGVWGHVWGTRGATALRTIESVPKFIAPKQYSLAKSVYLPNLRHITKVVSPSASYYKGRYLTDTAVQIKSLFPTIKAPAGIGTARPYMLTKSVVLPNLKNLKTVFSKSAEYYRTFYDPTITAMRTAARETVKVPRSITTQPAYMLARDVYIPNILGQTFQPHKLVKSQLGYYREFLPNVALPKIPRPTIGSIGSSLLGEERFLYYRHVATPMAKTRIQDAFTGFKQSFPSRPEVSLPDWVYVTKEAGKGFAQEFRALSKVREGMVRWKLHLPLKEGLKPYKPMATFIPLAQTTAEKTLSTTMLTKPLTKPTTLAKAFTPVMGVVAPALRRVEKKEKKEVISTVPDLVRYSGPPYKSIYEMKRKFPYPPVTTYPKGKVATLKLTKKQTRTLSDAGFKSFVKPMGLQKLAQLRVQKQKQVQKSKQIQTLIHPQATQLEQKQKRRKLLGLRQTQLLGQQQIQEQRQAQSQRVRQLQVQLQAQTQGLAKPLELKLGFGRLERRARRPPRYGAWFRKRHPIAKPRAVMGLVYGGNGKEGNGRRSISAFNSRMSRLEVRTSRSTKRRRVQPLERRVAALIG